MNTRWSLPRWLTLSLILGMLAHLPARAHEARPAYLEIREMAPGGYSVLWRTPVMTGMRLPIVLKLPDGVRKLKDPTVQGANGLAG